MKRVVKNTILASMLIVGLGSTAVADNLENDLNTFLGLTWSPSTDGGTIEGYEFDGSGMIGVLGGKKDLFSDNFGAYMGIDISYNTVDDTYTSNEAIYSYTLINIGATYSPINYFTLLGGVGYSIEDGEYVSYGTHYETVKDHNEMNFHFGAIYKFTNNLGVIVGYNTAPSAMNYGIVLGF